MNLWNKPIHEITFADVDEFCKQQIAESTRLDYKLEPPDRELSNLVAAFANTLGGLIVLGVDADKTTNKPIWPPNKGMAKAPGIEEQITSLCQDNIYPPVRPQISTVLDNARSPGNVVVVIRVDESPEAPHTVNQGKRVYERTGPKNKDYDFAHIDRIQHLLTRRQRIEEQREQLIQEALGRSRRRMSDPLLLPVRWASVAPMFPWQDLCSRQVCLDAYNRWIRLPHSGREHDWVTQQVSGGMFSVGYDKIDGAEQVTATRSLNGKGHVFALEYTLEQLGRGFDLRLNNSPTGDVGFLDTVVFAGEVFESAARFFRVKEVAVPGYLSLSLGLFNVFHQRMVGPQWRGKHFLDLEFRADLSVHSEEFLENPKQAMAPFYLQLAFGFDLPIEQIKQVRWQGVDLSKVE
jgi:hypothetical protein